MTSLRHTIIPKSDQLNSDDFIAGPMTVKITKISIVDSEQPIAIHFEGDNGKPFKPCKSMRRVLIAIWGDDGNNFIGKSMTLYRDPKVKWGGDEVGGIRISHMSDITHKVQMSLTATRGSRKPFTVLPLLTTEQTYKSNVTAEQVEAITSSTIDEEILTEGDAAAERGTSTLKAFWESLRPGQQKMLVNNISTWKTRATEVDKAVKETGADNIGAG